MDIPISDHFDGKVFFNPEPTIRNPAGKRISIWRFMRARMARDPAIWSTWPKHVENKPYPAPSGDGASITFIGHASFLIRLPGMTILTDPVFSKRCSPSQLIGPQRVRDPGIALKNLPEINLILLSHNHYDHMDLISLRRLKKRFPYAAIIAPLGNRAYLVKKRIKDATELDWWQSVEVGEANITVTPARHFAARSFFDRNETLWGGFWISYRGRNIYFAGDTGYMKFFKELREKYGAPDLALLPIGAYEPRSFMGPVHMNPEDAVMAFQDLHAKQALGMHFGTFQLTAEAIDAPLHALAAAREAEGIPAEAFGALDVGENLSF